MSKVVARKGIGVHVHGGAVRLVKTGARGQITGLGAAQMGQTDDLTQAIKQAMAAAGCGGGRCSVSVADREVILQTAVLPYMEGDALTRNAHSEIASHLALSADAYHISYKITGLTQTGNQRQIKLMLAAVQRQTADRLMGALKEAGLRATHLEVSENALEKLISLSAPGQNAAVLEVSGTEALFTVFLGGRFYISRFLTETLEADLPAGEPMDAFVSEVSSVLEYGYYRERHQKVGRLFVGGAVNESQRDYLGETLGIPSAPLQELLTPHLAAGGPQTKNAADFGAAYGALLREVSL